MGDWKETLQRRFAELETTAREDAETEAKMLSMRGVKDANGQEHWNHTIAEPQPCQHCGLVVNVEHDCIVELRKALQWAQGNIQVVRR